MDGSQDGFAVLACALRLLAGDDERRIDHALQVVADGLSVEATLTLREAGRTRTSAVIATSGLALVPAQSRSANALLDIPLRHDGRLAAALCVVAAAPLDLDDLGLLSALADALTLAVAPVLPTIDARRQVLEIEEERSDVANAIGDGPLPALVAALYVCESSEADSPATEHVRSALDELRRVEKSLVARSLAGDLAVSLRAAVAASRRTGAEVRLDLPSRLLPCSPVEAVTAYHVVLASLAGVRTQSRVTVDLAEAELTVTVTGAHDPHDTGTLARWARRAAALDGRLDRHLDGVTLVLPWSPSELAGQRSEPLVVR
jgi:hypothetical protein